MKYMNLLLFLLLSVCYGKSKYSEHPYSQCHVKSIQQSGDRIDNPIFNGGGFIGSYTGPECAAFCDDMSNTDKHGRTCVAFEHSSQDYNAVASCALAWGCDFTESWSGGKTYIRSEQYTEHAYSQCHVNSIQHSGDRVDNPIFNGGGFIGSYTGPECAAFCDDLSNTDKHGRTCVAFEHSSQDYNAVASCALAWGCDFTESWSGGKTYIKSDKYIKHGYSQCYVNNIQESGDRVDNPIFNGGGFIGSYTGPECAAFCDDLSNTDDHGRTCVAFEHSSQDYNAVASCALAWGCDYTKSWSGGNTYVKKIQYHVADSQMTLPSARSYCHSHGGFLAKPRDETDRNSIRTLLPSGNVRAWLGIYQTNDLTWLKDNGENMGWTNWRSGEGNDRRGLTAGAGMVWQSGWTGEWYDMPNYDGRLHYVVCEIPSSSGRRALASFEEENFVESGSRLLENERKM